MTLIAANQLDEDALAYRIFGVTRDKEPWRAADIIRDVPRTTDPAKASMAWQIASRGYYAEQAGLTAAATLAAHTEDAPLRFSLALAAGDEARHADAFYQYAKMAGGEPEPCVDEVTPLDDLLISLPHMGRALLHVMLEGFAADEFILFGEWFADDPLGRLYHHIRRDEVRHIAIGLNYLARSAATPAGRDVWREHAGTWHAAGMELTAIAELCDWLGDHIQRDPVVLTKWFLRRHHARLRAVGIEIWEGGEPL